jgi:hypothetical protein
VAVATPDPTAIALPADVMGDLLRDQQGQVSTPQRLPTIKMMAAGACLFEFGDTQATEREFEAVILHGHARNVLWDKAYGTGPTLEDGSAEGPACGSPDGQHGRPRAGFEHPALGTGVACTGEESIACSGCPCNAWQSAHLIGKQGKGKACTNQRSVYVWVPGANAPHELTLPPTSISMFDEYLTTLLNRSIPMQTVLTKFTQERQERGQLRWAVARFAVVRQLEQEEVSAALAKRAEFMRVMTPRLGTEPTPNTIESTFAATGDLPF